RRLRAGRGDRSALHPLHLGNDGAPEGRGARQWRPHGRARMVDEESLRHRSGRGVLGGVRRRLGGVCGRAPAVGGGAAHSYTVYAPLFHGCTTILYEGKPVGTPDAGAFWRVIAEHGAVEMFTAPTAFRAIKKEDPQGKLFAQYDLSKFRTLFLAGERADPDTIGSAENLPHPPVIDDWWR